MADADDRKTEADRLLAEFSNSFPVKGSLTEALGTLHEFYLSLKSVGFNEFQSLWIVGYVATGGSTPSEDQ